MNGRIYDPLRPIWFALAHGFVPIAKPSFDSEPEAVGGQERDLLLRQRDKFIDGQTARAD